MLLILLLIMVDLLPTADPDRRFESQSAPAYAQSYGLACLHPRYGSDPPFPKTSNQQQITRRLSLHPSPVRCLSAEAFRRRNLRRRLSTALEVLHFLFVFLGRAPRLERAQISSFPRLGVFRPGI
jgi:hypothetical protein